MRGVALLPDAALAVARRSSFSSSSAVLTNKCGLYIQLSYSGELEERTKDLRLISDRHLSCSDHIYCQQLT